MASGIDRHHRLIGEKDDAAAKRLLNGLKIRYRSKSGGKKRLVNGGKKATEVPIKRAKKESKTSDSNLIRKKPKKLGMGNALVGDSRSSPGSQNSDSDLTEPLVDDGMSLALSPNKVTPDPAATSEENEDQRTLTDPLSTASESGTPLNIPDRTEDFSMECQPNAFVDADCDASESRTVKESESALTAVIPCLVKVSSDSDVKSPFPTIDEKTAASGCMLTLTERNIRRQFDGSVGSSNVNHPAAQMTGVKSSSELTISQVCSAPMDHAVHPHALQEDFLDAEERRIRQSAQAIKEIATSLAAEKKRLADEYQALEGHVATKRHAVTTKLGSISLLKEKKANLSDDILLRQNQRDRLNASVSEAMKKLFEAELSLRELQVAVCKGRMALVAGGCTENILGEPVLEHDEKVDEYQKEIDRRKKTIQQTKELLQAAQDELAEKFKEEREISQKEEVLETEVKIVQVELNKDEAKLLQISQELSSNLIEQRRQHVAFIDLEVSMAKVRMYRKLAKLYRKKEEILGKDASLLAEKQHQELGGTQSSLGHGGQSGRVAAAQQITSVQSVVCSTFPHPMTWVPHDANLASSLVQMSNIRPWSHQQQP